MQNEETVHRNFCVSYAIRIHPGTSERCNSLWSDVSLRALIPVEDILNICCELWLDKQKELNSLLQTY
jgi:hypothetical protein